MLKRTLSYSRASIAAHPCGRCGDQSNPNSLADKHWEYSNDISGVIARAGTAQIVLNLSDDVPRPQDASVIWSPDSKRFGFNHSPPHALHTSYETTVLYQLQGDKWVQLKSLTELSSGRAQLTQLARNYLPSDTRERHVWNSSPTRDILRVHAWHDAHTAIIYAYAAWDTRGVDQGAAAFLFTLKFDLEGRWKMVSAHRMSKKELEVE